MKRLLFIIIAAAALSMIAVPFAFSNGQAQASSSGTASQAKTIFLGISTKTVTNPWEAYFQDSFIWFAKDHHWKYIAEGANGDPAVQLQQSRQMINRGITGLIVSAQDAEAAVPIVQYASEHNIPVFTADADIESPNVKMYVGFSGERAGQVLGKDIVKYLQNKYNGQTKGTILEMMGPLGGASAQQRSKGLHDVVDQYPNIKVIQAEGNFQQQPAETAAADKLRATPNIDAIYGANGPMACGAVQAMKNLNMDPKSVYVATVDATPCVINMLNSGDISVALDQAAGFYVPIAEHYLAAYIQHGASALPQQGATITGSELNLNTGVKHAGILPWQDNSAWAPALITTEWGHLWFQTGAILVTKANANDPSLWANVPLNKK